MIEATNKLTLPQRIRSAAVMAVLRPVPESVLLTLLEEAVAALEDRAGIPPSTPPQ